MHGAVQFHSAVHCTACSPRPLAWHRPDLPLGGGIWYKSNCPTLQWRYCMGRTNSGQIPRAEACTPCASALSSSIPLQCHQPAEAACLIPVPTALESAKKAARRATACPPRSRKLCATQRHCRAAWSRRLLSMPQQLTCTRPLFQVCHAVQPCSGCRRDLMCTR